MKVLSHKVDLLGKALIGVHQWPKNAYLLLSFEQSWRIDSDCVVAETDPYNEDEAKIKLNNHTFEETLQKNQVEEIIDNSSQQLGPVSQERALKAFLYYYDNDAFIDWNEAT